MFRPANTSEIKIKKKLSQEKLKKRVFKAKSDNYASASITVVEFSQTKSPNPPQHPFAKF